MLDVLALAQVSVVRKVPPDAHHSLRVLTLDRPACDAAFPDLLVTSG